MHKLVKSIRQNKWELGKHYLGLFLTVWLSSIAAVKPISHIFILCHRFNSSCAHISTRCYRSVLLHEHICKPIAPLLQ